MHEMSLMESVREIVEDASRVHDARRVAVVRVRIGALAAVDPDALRFAFDVVMRGGCAEGARFEIELQPGAGWCWDCARSVVLSGNGTSCPDCGGHRLEVTGGTEMRVHEIELASDEEAASCA
ncbi:MAG TPA: hydrogenase maturation nickel metallochaperone HypA [Steroidobacteraceae bacterium]|nr:hydrogenase maturation nickel metallochaperone HypA [Steroidobacteraceae bacterium]